MQTISPTMKSCLFTKGLTAKFTKGQEIGKPYSLPGPEARVLCAMLVLEEAMETVRALGVSVTYDDHAGHWVDLEKLRFRFNEDVTFQADDLGPKGLDESPSERTARLEDVIDGACDTIYVATGVLAACGVPDIPHLREVCLANDRKFPKSRVITGAGGKYLKPAGWKGPDHAAVRKAHKRKTDLRTTAATLVRRGKST